MELRCDDLKAGRTLLTKRYHAPTYSATSFLYVVTNDFNYYPDMLAGVYKDFMQNLSHALP